LISSQLPPDWDRRVQADAKSGEKRGVWLVVWGEKVHDATFHVQSHAAWLGVGGRLGEAVQESLVGGHVENAGWVAADFAGVLMNVVTLVSAVTKLSNSTVVVTVSPLSVVRPKSLASLVGKYEKATPPL